MNGVGPCQEELARRSVAMMARVMVERLQVGAGLVAGEARRRGFEKIAGPYELSPWVVPLQWEEAGREMMSTTDMAYRGAAPFPTDPAFSGAAAGARDKARAQTGESQRAFLFDPADRVRRILRRR